MLILRYRHRLPADYGLDPIRARVAARAPDWDAVPGLGFKAFAISEGSGRGTPEEGTVEEGTVEDGAAEGGGSGAAGNGYSSTYLWLTAGAAAGFLTDARFQAVEQAFGRPRVAMLLPLGVQVGRRPDAAILERETRALEPGIALARLRSAEGERCRAAVIGGAAAAFSGLDPTTWTLTRFTLGTEARPAIPSEDVLHLAAPGWAQLPH